MSSDELHSDLRISTMTQIAKVSSDINLKELYTHLKINDVIKYIEFADLPGKGVRLKPKKVVAPRKGQNQKPTKRKKYFYNQVTIHIFNQKIVNVKIFNNGGIQMTGLKGIQMGDETVNRLLTEIQAIPRESVDAIYCQDPEGQDPEGQDPEGQDPEGQDPEGPKPKPSLMPENTKIVMINSDFDMGFRINREVLHRCIIDANYYSSFESAIYPGVNIKYYYNLDRQVTGICNCPGPCDGKGHDGTCKKITIAVFNSGKIIITGAQSLDHIHTAHKFITDFIHYHEDFIREKPIS
jgi:hypothetical protein